MKEEYQFTFNNGAEVLRNKILLIQLDAILDQYEFMKEENILQFLDESSIVCCMMQDSKIIGCSWIVMNEEEKMSELSWLFMDRQKSKGLEGKLLLNKIIEYCKGKNISSIKFNCVPQSWGKIKNIDKLLSRFGFELNEQEKDYDVSIKIQ